MGNIEIIEFLDGLKESLINNDIEINIKEIRQGAEKLPPPVDDRFTDWEEYLPNGHKEITFSIKDLRQVEELEKEKSKRT